MIELLTANGQLTELLTRVSFVVIDEADRMFDFGFEPQLTKLLQGVRPDKQTLLFSATFPKNVEALARRILASPVEIVVGTRGQSCRAIDQRIEVIEESAKLRRALQLLGEFLDKGSVIIFVETQQQADELFT